MAKHKITKKIDFCYGHRLLEHKGKCRNLHGHNGVLEIDIVSDAARIIGLLGTLKVKGDPRPDRPHRRSRLDSVPEQFCVACVREGIVSDIF